MLNKEIFDANEKTIEIIKTGEEVAWKNPRFLPYDYVKGIAELVVSDVDIKDAEERLARFAPFIMKKFPETAKTMDLLNHR